MRSVVQGLDTRGSWDRYLRLEGEHDDIRHVHRTIQWIRDEFAAAAKRHDRFGTARLVRMDASRIEDKASVIPTLEEFAEEYGLLDFSEAEQLEAYHERFGARTSKESRRARLIAKQLDALAWLESLHTQAPPRWTDAVASWLHPDLAVRLESSGIQTIGDLVNRINGLGMRWWSGIRAIGVTKARRIMDWLHANESTIGLAIGAHVRVKRSTLDARQLTGVVRPATAIVPLEKLMLPADLDGSEGSDRAPHYLCRIPARNDVEAVLAWIKTKGGVAAEGKTPVTQTCGANPVSSGVTSNRMASLSHTQRAYRKEAERFLLWTVVQQKKPLSSITEDDCYAYLAFVKKPTPAERWCAPRGRERWSPLWRPFEGPLSVRAQRQAVTILKNLFAFLVERGYLARNPWKTVALPQREHRGEIRTAAAPLEWPAITQKLDHLPETSAGRRMRFALHLMSATGLRLTEVVTLRVDHILRKAEMPDVGTDGMKKEEGWQLAVAGKGGEIRTVTLDRATIAALSDYLASRSLEPDPLHPANRGAYLIGKASDVAERAPWAPQNIKTVDPKAGITAGILAKDIRRFFDVSAVTVNRNVHIGWT